MTSPEAWVALASLTVLGNVLGIDNIVFISVLSGKLPPEQQQRARVVGLALAMLTRVALLYSISLLTHLTAPIFTIAAPVISGRDLLFLLGGLFLIYKATQEIHERLEGPHKQASAKAGPRASDTTCRRATSTSPWLSASWSSSSTCAPAPCASQ